MYSGAAAPFGPTALLAATWRGSAALAGYAPRDAHETFIGALNALHAGSRGSTNVSCNCVVHTAFAGALQSDVRCGAARCGSVRTTVDPMLDVSLEIAGGEDGETLAGCLRRWVRPRAGGGGSGADGLGLQVHAAGEAVEQGVQLPEV